MGLRVILLLLNVDLRPFAAISVYITLGLIIPLSMFASTSYIVLMAHYDHSDMLNI